MEGNCYIWIREGDVGHVPPHDSSKKNLAAEERKERKEKSHFFALFAFFRG